MCTRLWKNSERTYSALGTPPLQFPFDYPDLSDGGLLLRLSSSSRLCEKKCPTTVCKNMHLTTSAVFAPPFVRAAVCVLATHGLVAPDLYMGGDEQPLNFAAKDIKQVEYLRFFFSSHIHRRGMPASAPTPGTQGSVQTFAWHHEQVCTTRKRLACLASLCCMLRHHTGGCQAKRRLSSRQWPRWPQCAEEQREDTVAAAATDT